MNLLSVIAVLELFGKLTRCVELSWAVACFFFYIEKSSLVRLSACTVVVSAAVSSSSNRKNAAIRVSRSTLNWFRSKNIDVLPCLLTGPQSDGKRLGKLVRRTYCHGKKYGTIGEFKDAISVSSSSSSIRHIVPLGVQASKFPAVVMK
uniref:Uncharacterized protein n=1 Tax=Caenorhabditis japonica TaxID=281687 RepID=A0A8R1ISR7_CAEJA